MKRFVILFAFLLLICSLMGCRRIELIYESYQTYQSTEEIAKIEVVRVRYKSEEKVKVFESQIYNNNFESVVYYSEIPEESYQDFVSELISIPCYRTMPPFYSRVWGEGFLITYKDGSWELINYSGPTYYDASEEDFHGSVLHFNDDEFNALWLKYSQEEDHEFMF